MDDNGIFLLLVPIPILITWFLLDIVRKLSIKLKIFAVPNERSSHDKITPITGIIMTKLDGTAKGGILLAIGRKFKIPIIALGMGEKEDDLQIFNALHYSNALMIN